GSRGRATEPCPCRSRDELHQFLPSPFPFGRKCSVAKCIGEPPTDLEQRVQIADRSRRIVMVYSDGSRQLIGEIPVLGQKRTRQTVIDLEEILFGAQQIE